MKWLASLEFFKSLQVVSILFLYELFGQPNRKSWKIQNVWKKSFINIPQLLLMFNWGIVNTGSNNCLIKLAAFPLNGATALGSVYFYSKRWHNWFFSLFKTRLFATRCSNFWSRCHLLRINSTTNLFSYFWTSQGSLTILNPCRTKVGWANQKNCFGMFLIFHSTWGGLWWQNTDMWEK